MGQMFAEDVHARRVLSLANGVAGVLNAAVLGVHAIGQAYARVAGITPKSGTKQIDRMLSNDGIDVRIMMSSWVRSIVAERSELVLMIDWTDFDDDDHTTLYVGAATGHGRATPVAWQTIKKSELAGRRTQIEHEMVEWLHDCIDPKVRVVLLGDRGFGDQKLYELLGLYGWDYAIRFRGIIVVEHQGVVREAKEWLNETGRARMLRGALVTRDRAEVPAVVVAHDRRMKEPLLE
jgi:hypothetical protein